MDSEGFPQYLRIAQDMAAKVAAGELEKTQKITGRSVLSSHYNVSPETIRRALRLLVEMRVLEVREKSGYVVLSQDNARRFLDNFHRHSEQHELMLRLHRLVEQQNSLHRQMEEVCNGILSAQERPLPQDQCLPNYSVRVADESDKIGRSIGSLHFWQETGATIIAIRRNGNTMISPGPFAELYGGDYVVFIGQPETPAAVERFLNGNVSVQGGI